MPGLGEQVPGGQETQGDRVPEACLLVMKGLPRSLAVAGKERSQQWARVTRSDHLPGQLQAACQALGMIPEVAKPAFDEASCILRQQIVSLSAELMGHGACCWVVTSPDGFDRSTEAVQGAFTLVVQGALDQGGFESQPGLDDGTRQGPVDRCDEPALPRVPDDETGYGQLRQRDADGSAPESETLFEIGFVDIMARDELTAHESLSQAPAREGAMAFAVR